MGEGNKESHVVTIWSSERCVLRLSHKYVKPEFFQVLFQPLKVVFFQLRGSFSLLYLYPQLKNMSHFISTIRYSYELTMACSSVGLSILVDRALRLINRKGQGSIPSQGCLLNCEDLFHSNFILLSPNKHTGLCSPFISWFGSVGLCRCLVVLISNNFFIFAEAVTEQSGLQCKRSSFLVVEVKININKLNRRHKAKTNGVEGGFWDESWGVEFHFTIWFTDGTFSSNH